MEKHYLHDSICIPRYLIFPHPIGIVIGSDAYIAKNVVVYQHVTIGWKSIQL